MNANIKLLNNNPNIDNIVIGIYNWLNYQDKEQLEELIEYSIPSEILASYTRVTEMYRGMIVNLSEPLRNEKYSSWSKCGLVCSRFRSSDMLIEQFRLKGCAHDNIVSQLYYKEDSGFMLSDFICDLIESANDESINGFDWGYIEEVTGVYDLEDFEEFCNEFKDEEEVVSSFDCKSIKILYTIVVGTN